MNFERKTVRRRPVSMVAMINIIFLLIVFFIIAGNVEKFEIIPVEVPIAKSGKLLDEGPVVIVLGRYDEILLGDELISTGQIGPMLQQALKDNPNKIITIKADARMRASDMIRVLDMIRAAGGSNISLETQSAPKEGGA